VEIKVHSKENIEVNWQRSKNTSFRPSLLANWLNRFYFETTQRTTLGSISCFTYTNLGFAWLCTTNDNQWINLSKNELIFSKLSYNWMKILNDITCTLNWIKFMFNWKKIRCKLMEKALNFFSWIQCWKISTPKREKSKKYTFPCLFIWEWAKWILDWNLVGKNPMGPYSHLT
jgi:hypothetical protein